MDGPLGTIHILYKLWTGSENSIFQYINHAYIVTGWVRKCSKICLGLLFEVQTTLVRPRTSQVFDFDIEFVINELVSFYSFVSIKSNISFH